MNELSESRKINPVDSLVDSYKESLKSSFGQSLGSLEVLDSKEAVLPDSSHVSQQRLMADLDAIRTTFLNTVFQYESEFKKLQSVYDQISKQVDFEHKNLQSLYGIRAQANSLSELQKEYSLLEKQYQSHYEKLQAEFESKQLELAQYIGAERKLFEEGMFEKRRQWESEMDALDVALQRRRKECELAERELEKEIHQKRNDWAREESVLEKDYHQKRLRFDQQMAEYETSFEYKTRVYREKEMVFRDECLKKEQELQKKITLLEEQKNKVGLELSLLEKQYHDKKLAEEEVFFSRKLAFEKELDELKVIHEKKLQDQQNKHLEEYLNTRDTLVDQKHKDERDKLGLQISDLKSRVRSMQKAVDDAVAEKAKSQDQYRRDLERYQKEITDLALRSDSEKKHLESALKEKIEKEFYMKLQEVEAIYTQEISELKRYNQALELQLSQERSVIKRLETGMRQSNIQAEQLLINSIENQQKSGAYSTQTASVRTQRIVRPARFKES